MSIMAIWMVMLSVWALDERYANDPSTDATMTVTSTTMPVYLSWKRGSSR
jgi:hypothetical protein